jgi:uncharacterized PurR-regulated membrane protein YhhQ (DUF165 family)
MPTEALVLIIEAMIIYFLVLWAHSLRHRFGLAHFYALMGGITAVMSWITDAGVKVELLGITFMVGSTVFYTALLLGVFVVYVFDGPRATRIAISTVIGVSAMVPMIALVLHFQMKISGHTPLGYIPMPSLRINMASVIATLMDLIFLAICWEYLGKNKLQLNLWFRSFTTLLGVMWLDVVLFATGAFFPGSSYVSIMTGTLLSRLIISVFACPFLWLYLSWQNIKKGIEIENRPVLSILKQVAEIEHELTLAQQEIERRKKVEKEKEGLITELKQAVTEIKTLRGFLPICAHCKKIRDDEGYWQQLEKYIQDHSDAKFSHGICPDCISAHYPEIVLKS